jgi:thiamine-monophosphate kinase
LPGEREIVRKMQDALGVRLQDDCAFIRPGAGRLALSLDRIAESTHVPAGADPGDVGWHAVAVSLSDLAAGGARPMFIAAAFGLSPDWVPKAESIARGMRECCKAHGARFVAGDTKYAAELEITSVALGVAARPMKRSGARIGDLVGVTGTLGRASIPFLVDGKERAAAVKQMLRFRPRLKEGIGLARIAGACIDVSDGLATSLHQLAKASRKRIVLYDRSLPIDEEFARVAQDRGLWPDDVKWLALNFGGDYELAFTFPKRWLPRVKYLLRDRFHMIGRVERGSGVVDVSGARVSDEGYEHLGARSSAAERAMPGKGRPSRRESARRG